MNKGTILSVDDDSDLQIVISQYLESEGYKVLTAGSVTEASAAAEQAHDAVLLDLNLPDGEGLSLIPKMREKSKASIIVVSGKDNTTDKVVCLEMGADDYMTKPFEMRELSARLKAVMRRSSELVQANDAAEAKPEKITLGSGWILDKTQYQLFSPDGQSAELTTGEFQLLEALVDASNRALSRERLFELTREGRFDAYDRAIDIQIGRIRKKLGAADSIKTVRGVGYMFTNKA